MKELRSIPRAVGSLWFAAVLLMLLLVGMACATVFEATHGTEQALATFYRSWWFEALLALLAVNVATSVLVRYPFSKKLIGFVLTHTSILVIIIGAVVTKNFGVDGVVGVAEGQTVDFMSDRQQDTLTIANQVDQTRSVIDLDPSVFRRFRGADRPDAPALKLGAVQVGIRRYLPDSEWSRQVIDDDDPGLESAVEVALSAAGQDDATWVFANHSAALGAVSVALRPLADAAELARLTADQPASQRGSAGTVKVTCAGVTFDIPLEDCLKDAVPLGDTGYTVRVRRYLPHAIVGQDSRLISASTQPVNPAIEVEIVGASENETRICFARFPGFKHGRDTIADLDVTFIAKIDTTPRAPIEVLSGPDGELHVRFSWQGTPVVTHKLTIGTAVETPWPDREFTVLRRFEHARVSWSLKRVEPVRKDRTPALLLEVAGQEQADETWVQKYRPGELTVDGTPYELTYADKRRPLGFALTLNRFRVGTYPGGNQPRSFESHITVIDPATGRAQDRVISMNRPTSLGGYTLYQSSYDERGGKTISYLSVSRDPGRPIVFAGYIGLMAGMLVILGTRLASGRRVTGPAAAAGTETIDSAAPSAALTADSNGERAGAAGTTSPALAAVQPDTTVDAQP